jgi:hypothetical protein
MRSLTAFLVIANVGTIFVIHHTGTLVSLSDLHLLPLYLYPLTHSQIVRSILALGSHGRS